MFSFTFIASLWMWVSVYAYVFTCVYMSCLHVCWCNNILTKSNSQILYLHNCYVAYFSGFLVAIIIKKTVFAVVASRRAMSCIRASCFSFHDFDHDVIAVTALLIFLPLMSFFRCWLMLEGKKKADTELSFFGCSQPDAMTNIPLWFYLFS